MAPKDSYWAFLFSSLFHNLFPHTSTFYKSKTYKCQKPRFLIVSNNKTVFTLVPLSGQDLQVRCDRFYQLDDKLT